MVDHDWAPDRYQASKFLDEGGKKRVYQAHDTLLDRKVAFTLIKTQGFGQTSEEHISREAQAMGIPNLDFFARHRREAERPLNRTDPVDRALSQTQIESRVISCPDAFLV